MASARKRLRDAGPVRRIARLRGVGIARRAAAKSVRPFVGVDEVKEILNAHNHRIGYDSDRIDAQQEKIRQLEIHHPTLLNAIASTSGTARILTRQSDHLRDEFNRKETEQKLASARIKELVESHRVTLSDMHDRFSELERRIDDVASGTERAAAMGTQQSSRLDLATSRIDAMAVEVTDNMHRAAKDSARVESAISPHVETIAYLLRRVETVRAEMLHELRYGPAKSQEAKDLMQAKVLNPAKLQNGDLRINLGAGHIALPGFVNVDIRELPEIDVVAAIDALPFDKNSLTEIFSSHTLEHFPELELRRKLLPYWFGLLKPGGTFRSIVPDLEAMTLAYAAGEMSFEDFRSVTYGGQEYEHDFHFTGFTPDSLREILLDAGFASIRIVASGRPNGACLEFEIAASRPESP